MASPDGRKVFVTGTPFTIAYNAATGARLWVSNNRAETRAVAVSPDGKTVYVTGFTPGACNNDFLTTAYSAVTGARRWVKLYNSPGCGQDYAFALAVSPDSRRVFVVGGPGSTVAYSAATGARLWVRQSGWNDSVAVSADGRKVFVTGNCTTTAYSAATGARLWAARVPGPVSRECDTSFVAAPGNGTVYVTGSSEEPNSGVDYITLAYRAATGHQLWARRYNGPANGPDHAESLAVSPTGTVLVTGYSAGGSQYDWATIAYSASGAPLGVHRYNGPGNADDFAYSMAAPGNGKVYVTGSSTATNTGLDYTTIAYNVSTGAQRWLRRYNGPDAQADGADDRDYVCRDGPAWLASPQVSELGVVLSARLPDRLKKWLVAHASKVVADNSNRRPVRQFRHWHGRDLRGQYRPGGTLNL